MSAPAALLGECRALAFDPDEPAAPDGQLDPCGLVDVLPLAICVLDGQGRVIAVNDGWRSLAHDAGDECLMTPGKRFLDVAPRLCADADGYGRFLDGVRAVLRGAAADALVEFRCRRGGVARWILGRARRFRANGVARVLLTGADVTARRLAQARVEEINAGLEQRVQERSAELRAAVESLESFARTAHHDLRAPVRSIAGYAQLLLTDHSAALEPTACDYLAWIERAARRMGETLDGMLALSECGQEEMLSEPIDMAALASDVWRELAPEPDTASRLEVGRLPRAMGDPRLVRQVLQNLLGNALKYTSRTSQPRIEVRAVDAGAGQVGYCVRDNGVGFDPLHAGSLFRPFCRLHTAAQFPGSGIGLATVRRIVERHGGRVWAHGVPGEGAAFHFTLPAEDAA